jgi:precorrin-8X/cobalt-precorrin-8 methylmutase
MNNLADYGIVVAGHGSRDPEGVKEFEALIDCLRSRTPGRKVTYGFLEFARPTIDEAVRENVASGAREIVVVPGVLLAATHAKNDMPSEVLALQAEMPDVKLHYGAAMHLHPLILKLCREKIIEAEARSTQVLKRSETCLVVVGRGTTDPDANSDVSKLARILEEGLGFGGSFVCYSGTARPLLAEGLATAAKLGFKRLVVAPFFLFTGILVKRIQAAAEEMVGHLAGMAEHHLLVSFAPYTPLLALLKGIGQLFPGPSKTTSAYQLKEEGIVAAAVSAGLQPVYRSLNQAPFYFSRLVAFERP